MGKWLAAVVMAAAAFGTPLAVASESKVALVEIDGAIGPATSAYYEKAQAAAIASGASALILRIDTPGGLDSAMREIIRQILAAPLPVIAWVGPGGARAASAGTYILMACHVAAMAPATNLGAATPIPVGGSWPLSEPPGDAGKGADGTDEGNAESAADIATAPAPTDPPHRGPVDAAQAKALNDAVAYIRSLAEKRGRNADWAETAVREGASLSASAALAQGVVDVVAEDIDALLEAVDGRSVELAGRTVTLQTAAARVERIEPDWRIDLLAVLTNPTVAYVLMLIGIYGLLLEGYNPGATLPGVVGAICLLLALYAFQLLPVNYVGLGLILLGVVLMVAEAIVPNFGVLGFGGAAAFVLGSVMLMDIDVPGYGINLGIVAGIALSAVALLAATLYLLWRSRHARVITGDDSLVGHQAEVIEVGEDGGWVEVLGERWRFHAQRPLRPGQKARVVARDGLLLEIEPIEQTS